MVTTTCKGFGEGLWSVDRGVFKVLIPKARNRVIVVNAGQISLSCVFNVCLLSSQCNEAVGLSPV